MKATRTLAVMVLLFGVLVETTKADFTFGEPTNLGPKINSTFHESPDPIPADGLSLYFWRGAAWTDVGEDWLATRPTLQDPWSDPICLGQLDAPSMYKSVKVVLGLTTRDGLELYFANSESARPGGYGGLDLWMVKRATMDDDWSPPVNLGPNVNTQFDEMWPSLSPDGLELHFSGYSNANARPGGQGNSDLWVTRRVTRNDAWGEPVNLGSMVNSSAGDWRPCISADGLVLFFDSNRTGGQGQLDLYVSRRTTVSDPWQTPVNLGPIVNSSAFEECALLSPDGSTLFFDSGRPGGYGGHDIWQLFVLPTVDFNADGIVDAGDVCIMVEHWGENFALCDIGPMPWGDGVVDVEDLKVLVEHLFEEVDDPTLIAHWAMDETEGLYASDGAGENDAVVTGGPVWQPTGGQVNGAIQLDGVDDYLATEFVLDPAQGPFSILVWVKGGAPGQVVISQVDGANWLVVDAEGKLMTQLMGPGRDACPLGSQTIITDGKWHRIAFVRDGSRRSLYVDGTMVAEDTQSALPSSANGLYIGAGKGMEPGTFWSGLIDDVRIYSRAVEP